MEADGSDHRDPTPRARDWSSLPAVFLQQLHQLAPRGPLPGSSPVPPACRAWRAASASTGPVTATLHVVLSTDSGAQAQQAAWLLHHAAHVHTLEFTPLEQQAPDLLVRHIQQQQPLAALQQAAAAAGAAGCPLQLAALLLPQVSSQTAGAVAQLLPLLPQLTHLQMLPELKAAMMKSDTLAGFEGFDVEDRPDAPDCNIRQRCQCFDRASFVDVGATHLQQFTRLAPARQQELLAWQGSQAAALGDGAAPSGPARSQDACRQSCPGGVRDQAQGVRLTVAQLLPQLQPLLPLLATSQLASRGDVQPSELMGALRSLAPGAVWRLSAATAAVDYLPPLELSAGGAYLPLGALRALQVVASDAMSGSPHCYVEKTCGDDDEDEPSLDDAEEEQHVAAVLPPQWHSPEEGVAYARPAPAAVLPHILAPSSQPALERVTLRFDMPVQMQREGGPSEEAELYPSVLRLLPTRHLRHLHLRGFWGSSENAYAKICALVLDARILLPLRSLQQLRLDVLSVTWLEALAQLSALTRLELDDAHPVSGGFFLDFYPPEPECCGVLLDVKDRLVSLQCRQLPVQLEVLSCLTALTRLELRLPDVESMLAGIVPLPLELDVIFAAVARLVNLRVLDLKLDVGEQRVPAVGPWKAVLSLPHLEQLHLGVVANKWLTPEHAAALGAATGLTELDCGLMDVEEDNPDLQLPSNGQWAAALSQLRRLQKLSVREEWLVPAEEWLRRLPHVGAPAQRQVTPTAVPGLRLVEPAVGS